MAFSGIVLAKQYEAEIPIAYVPDASTDEGGLWFVMDKFEKTLQRSEFIVSDGSLQLHIEEMVCQLAGGYCSDIRVYVVNNPQFNASMSPNGMMVVHTGLLMRVTGDDELAAVLGHEIGHFLLAHSIKQWRRLRRTMGFAAFADFALGGLATLTAGLSSLSFGRAAETDSDLFGLQLLHKTGYSTDAAAQLWDYLEQERDADKSKSRDVPFFRTHPRTPMRAKRLRKESARLQQTPSLQPAPESRLRTLLLPHYESLMDAQVETRELEQLQQILDRHRQIGYPLQKIAFYEGELFRLRGQELDVDRAIEAYQHVVSEDPNMSRAHRELAYLFLKQNQTELALQHFKHYQRLDVDANDHSMTNYYVELLEKKLQ